MGRTVNYKYQRNIDIIAFFLKSPRMPGAIEIEIDCDWDVGRRHENIFAGGWDKIQIARNHALILSLAFLCRRS